MTLCIAAKFKGGIICASDLAISDDGAKRHLVDGKWFDVDEGVCLYAGTLFYAQEVQFAKGPLRNRLREVHERLNKEDDEGEKDSAEFLLVTPDKIRYYEQYGSYYDRGDYECIGNGADLGDGLMAMVYSPGRSERWLRAHLDNIFKIVNRKVDGVSKEWKSRVLYSPSR